jgi:hypothetical protein
MFITFSINSLVFKNAIEGEKSDFLILKNITWVIKMLGTFVEFEISLYLTREEHR